MMISIPMPVFPATANQQLVIDKQINHNTEEYYDLDKNYEIVSINNRFIFTLIIDLSMVLLIILLIYYPNYKKLDTIFTFIVFNVVIFLLTFVLNKVKISMGAAFGLFAVFSMLRYRTEGIDMKDMTYLFVFIALGLISGIQLDIDVLLIICAIIFVITILLDSNLILKREYCQIIQYEKIEMMKPALRKELIEELRDRTGLNIHRISIRQLDYLKDTANIKVYYYE
ncbi:MAG: DUF4956 domain-containing protein [Omnitrophica WOR_2 bacterium]